MVTFKAFRAIRPQVGLADEIATLPYDVLSSDEARDLAAETKYSYLHIDKAEVDLPRTVEAHDSAVYQKAADNLAAFLDKGWLEKDSQAHYYIYELTLDGRVQTGVVGLASVFDYENAVIKRHEYTLPEKEEDRIQHSLACDANTSPIFLCYREKADLTALIEEIKVTSEPLYDFESFYGVHHRVWQTSVDFEPLFAGLPELYITDGHHRTASAAKVSQRLRTAYGRDPKAEYNYFLSVAFPANELEILDYNRIVRKPLPVDFWERLGRDFEISPVEKGHKPERKHEISVISPDGWYSLKPKVVPADEVAGLDVSILQDKVLGPVLGIVDPKTDPNIEFVGGIRGSEPLEAAVTEEGVIAFMLYPPAMSELLAVADAGKIMPPKSTWFEPKLRSGLLVHLF